MEAIDLKDSSEPNLYMVKFHGTGFEYFRIWIVNLCLTIITLGIYGAWAKVRKQKYFAGATELSGSRFDFHGNPISILKGRILALLFLSAYFVVGHFAPALSILVAIGAVPWFLVKSLQFRFRYSSFRNIRFSFRGTPSEAYKIVFIYLWPMVAAAFINFFLHHFYGPLPEQLTVSSLALGHYLSFVVSIGSLLYAAVVFPKFLARGLEFIFNNVYYGIHKASLIADSKMLSKYIIKYPLVLFVAVVVISAIIGFLGSAFSGFHLVTMALIVLLLYATVYVMSMFFPFGLLHHNWTHLKIEGHPTQSNLKFPSYLKIVTINVLATAFTLGLFTPWAQVRYRKYILENRGVRIANPDAFLAGARPSEVSALGEGVEDLSDFDFEIGI